MDSGYESQCQCVLLRMVEIMPIRVEKSRREASIEDLIPAASPKYLESIKAARKDYQEGSVYSHAQVFKER